MSSRLFDRTVSIVERLLPSERGALTRAATAASALAVAPVRYVTQPITAEEAACDQVSGGCNGPTHCSTCCGSTNCSCGSSCCNGYTTMCCKITGNNYSCPSGAYVGGWWYCCFTGTGKLCSSTGKRYFIDCQKASCKCQCQGGTCGKDMTCCNVFTYGNCGRGASPVICRLISCVNPATLACTDGCSNSGACDPATCFQTTQCLKLGASSSTCCGGDE